MGLTYRPRWRFPGTWLVMAMVACVTAAVPAAGEPDGPPGVDAGTPTGCETAGHSPDVALRWEAEGVAAVRSPLTGGLAAARYTVLIRDGAEWKPRVQIFAPDAEARPTARRVASLTASLWRTIDRRVGYAVPQLRQSITRVFLERGGSAGGENHQSDIHVMDYLSSRSDLEWIRTLCHEMGHYLLPGPGNYTDPEPWVNGLLGERLFTRWLLEDLVSKRTQPAALGYGGETDLRWYIDRQTDPLTERVASDGPDRVALADRGRKGGDAFCSLILFVDLYWGPRTVFDLLDYLPSRGGQSPDGLMFLTAFEAWVGAGDRSLTLSSGTVLMTYVPAGKRLVSGASVASLTAQGGGVTCERRGSSSWLVTARSGAWARVRATGTGQQVVLRWSRQ